MTILDKILAVKKKEVAALKEAAGLDNEPQLDLAFEVKPFAEASQGQNKMKIIAEIKRASPSKGMINSEVDPVKQAKIYAASGVQAISVLTDESFFKGSMDDLRAVRQAVDLPILNKDFIIHPLQIDRAHRAGASIILLIAAALSDDELRVLQEHALSLGLEVLFEVHDETELERVLALKPSLVGINNRNLNTFEVDLGTTARLARLVDDPDLLIVSESGLGSVEDVREVARAGARAILVGETFMRASALEETIRSFQVPLGRDGLDS